MARSTLAGLMGRTAAYTGDEYHLGADADLEREPVPRASGLERAACHRPDGGSRQNQVRLITSVGKAKRENNDTTYQSPGVSGADSGAALALNTLNAPAKALGDSSGPKKACLFGMLPGNLDIKSRFKLARDVGFEGVEANPTDLATADTMRAAAEKAGIHIHSVIYGGWDPPLSAPDPAAAAQSLKNAEAGHPLRAALRGRDDPAGSRHCQRTDPLRGCL